MRLAGYAAIIAMMTCSNVAMAQTMAERLACKDDFAKYCPGVKPGGGRIITCLSKQKDSLSPDCLKVVAAHSQ
jgi:hypothetical protein